MTSITRSQPTQKAIEADIASTGAAQPTARGPAVPSSLLQGVGSEAKKRRLNNAPVQPKLEEPGTDRSERIGNKFRVGNQSFSDVGRTAPFRELRSIAEALPEEEKIQAYVSMLGQLPEMPEAQRGHLFKSIMDSLDNLTSKSRACMYAEAASSTAHLRSDLKPLAFAALLAQTQKLELCDQAEPLTHLINSITHIDDVDHRGFYLSECLRKINTIPHESRRKPIGAAIAAVVDLPADERKGSLKKLLSVIGEQAPSKAADHMIEMIGKLPITLPDAPLSIMLQWILQSSAKLPTTEHTNVVLGAINYADGVTNKRTMASVVNSALRYVPLLSDQAQKKVAEIYIKHFLSVSSNVAVGIKDGRDKNSQLEELSALLTLSQGTSVDSPQFATQRNNLRQVMLIQLLETAAVSNYAHKVDMFELCKHLLPADISAAVLKKMQIPVAVPV